MDQQVLIIVGLVAVAAIAVASTIRRKVRQKQVAERLESGAKVVDVRTPSEFGSGHYPGAVNVPLDKLSKRIKKLGSRESSIVVYCASGSRSRVAVSRLRAAGFTDVVNAGAMANLPR
jgi:phage shock protein E